MNKRKPKPEWKQLTAMGIAFMLAGLLPLLAALGVDPLAEGMRAPPWVVGLAGSLFVVAGLYMLLQAAGASAVWGQIFATFIVLGLAGIANWVAFGDATGECTASVSVPLFTISDNAIPGCRIAFGYGALFTDSIVLLVLAGLLKNAPDLRPWGQRVEKLGIGLLLTLLAPLLLLLVPALLLGAGRELLKSLWGRWRQRS